MSESDTLKKINLGCGRRPLKGFVNLDKKPGDGVDVVADLEQPLDTHLHSQFDRLLMHHSFEHISNQIQLMEQLWLIARPGAELVIVCPYGSSDNAWEDPTHVKPIFKDTFIYFSPLVYGAADYAPQCDWRFVRREFRLDKSFFENFETLDEVQIAMAVANMRNVVTEFVAVLEAIKPMRAIATGVQGDKPPITSFKFV